MTSHPADDLSADLPENLPDDDQTGAVLPTFAVLARFRRAAPSAEQADEIVRRELQAARGLFDDTRLEPQDPDGRWPVDVRFVVVSVDPDHAVNGVHETLHEAGLAPDEVWVAERVA